MPVSTNSQSTWSGFFHFGRARVFSISRVFFGFVMPLNLRFVVYELGASFVLGLPNIEAIE